jgi:ZIP family zinc transporter
VSARHRNRSSRQWRRYGCRRAARWPAESRGGRYQRRLRHQRAAVTVGFFLAKLPQALSSVAGMRRAGRSTGYIIGLWAAVALLLVLIPPLAYALLAEASPLWRAVTLSVAAGAALGVLVEVMLPEAAHGAPTFAGLIAGFGFVGPFALGTATGF